MIRKTIILFIIFGNMLFPRQKFISSWKTLSLEDKIGKMIMVRVNGNYYQAEGNYKNLLKKWIKNYNIGGVITFSGSIHGTFYNIKEFQNWSNIPLFVAADYERGLGQWMDSATLFPSNMAVAATGNSDYAFQQGLVTSSESKSIGVNIVLGPVLDINNNPNNLK